MISARVERRLGIAAVVLALVATGCAKKQTETPADLISAGDQLRSAMDLLEAEKYAQAQEALKAITYSADDDRPRVEPLVRLAMADSTFYQGGQIAMIDARNLYLDFVTLNGDHPMAPYAQFQAGVCSLKQISNPSKDQTMTTQTLADFHEVSRRFRGSAFADASQRMLWEAEEFLAEHDFLVGRFYMKKKNFMAAVDRFRHIIDAYPQYDKIEKLYLYIGKALYKAENHVEAQIYLDKLVTDYPGGDFAPEARKLLTRVAGSLDTSGERAP